MGDVGEEVEAPMFLFFCSELVRTVIRQSYQDT